MKQVEVKILQQSYLLGCQEGQESRLLEAVARVDEAMTRIHDAGKVRARERIAVLAALNLAFELGDLRQELDLASGNATAEPAQGDALANGAAGADLDPQHIRNLIARIDQALDKGD